MRKHTRAKPQPVLHPTDPCSVLAGMVLGIGQAARIAGVSVRQLAYWTDKGYIPARRQQKGRAYDWAAIEKASLIKQALDKGGALEAAVAAAQEHLRGREEERRRVLSLSGVRLQQHLMQQAEVLQRQSSRIREQVALAKSSRLGELAVSFSGMEDLIRLLQRSPKTATTTSEIASRLGQPAKQVETQLTALERRRVVQRLRYPGSEVWRYTPQRAS